MAMAASANASVTLNTTNGNLSTKITADEGNGNLHDIVHGTDGVSAQDVIYDGNVDIAITGGSGFAEIDPGNGVTNFNSLVIDPLNNFFEYEFAIALVADGNVTVEYMLASNPGVWTIISSGGVTDPFAQNHSSNINYVVSSTDPLTELRLTTTTGFKFVKQNSITLATNTAAIPEPATWALMLLGFGGIGMTLRRSRRRNKPALMQIA